MLILAKADKAEIVHTVRAAAPYEACGLLIGEHDGRGNVEITKVVPSRNLMRDKGGDAGCDLFEIDPLVRLHWQKVLRGQKSQIIGHYHSHPNGQATPSLTDQKNAHEADLYWLIIAVDDNGAIDMAAFRPQKAYGPFDPVDLKIAD